MAPRTSTNAGWGAAKIPLGFVTIVIVVGFISLVTGNGGTGLAFLALSIICTAGISLVIYIPVSYALGSLVERYVFRVVYVSPKKGKKELKNASPAIKTISNYIDQVIGSGNPELTAIDGLRKAGWKDDQINAALAARRSTAA